MKMTIQERINEDLKIALKQKLQTVSDLRLLKAEMQRGEKVVSDDEAIKVLRGVRKGAEEMASLTQEDSLPLINLINEYLPKEMSTEEIISWIEANSAKIKENTNFGLAMRYVMGMLPSGTNGKIVSAELKKIL